jgi:hypothetical protein
MKIVDVIIEMKNSEVGWRLWIDIWYKREWEEEVAKKRLVEREREKTVGLYKEKPGAKFDIPMGCFQQRVYK